MLPGDAALRHRPFLDGEDRLAGHAIEGEEHAGLRALNNGGYCFAGDGKFDQRRLRSKVVVPDVVVDKLLVPDAFAATGIQCDQ